MNAPGIGRTATLGLVLAWIVAALAIDRYALRHNFPWFSDALYFQNAQIVVKPFDRTIAWLGLSLLIVAPSILVGLFLSIWLRMTKRATTTESFQAFGVIAFWFMAVPFVVWIGDNLYRFFKGFMEDWSWAKGLVAFLDGFVFKGDLYVYSFKVVHLDSGLGAIAGLMLGCALLYQRGLWTAIRRTMESKAVR